jgi:hypothetical protein
MNDQELRAQQRDVQRLLGRCLLRLQQYERLMKAVVAHHDLSGPAHTLEKTRAAHIDDGSTKTLGTLVRQLFGSYLVTAKTDAGADTTANELEDVSYFAMRY